MKSSKQPGAVGRVLVVASLLAACGGVDSIDAPSAECIELMHEAEAAPIVADREVQALVDSLTACETADQWLEGIRQVPGAMGLTERAEIGDLDLQVVCYGHEETPVCKDAAEDGRL